MPYWRHTSATFIHPSTSGLRTLLQPGGAYEHFDTIHHRESHLGAQTGDPTNSCRDIHQMQDEPKPVYDKPDQARVQAPRMVWPIACRRLDEFSTTATSEGPVAA